MTRRLFNKKDIGLISGIIFLALILHFIVIGLLVGAGLYAEVKVDGQVALTLDLTQEGEFLLPQNPEIKFKAHDGGIAFARSNCPDKVCVNTGFLHRQGQMAFCLPNRVSLTIKAEETTMTADMVAY